MNAQRNLGAVTSRLQGNFARLSSGLRIATASDDAAGLGISERMRSQIRSLEPGRPQRAGRHQPRADRRRRAERGQQHPDPHARAGHPGRQRHALRPRTARRSTPEFQRADRRDRPHRRADRVQRRQPARRLDARRSTIQVGIERPATRSTSRSHDAHRGDAGRRHARHRPRRRTRRPRSPRSTRAIDTVTTARGDAGRRRRTACTSDDRSSVRASRENLSAAESRIRDVDVADGDRRPDPQLDPAAGGDLGAGAGQRAAAARAVAAGLGTRLADGGGRSAPPPARPPAARRVFRPARRRRFLRSRIQFRFRPWADMRPRREAAPEDDPQAPCVPAVGG